MKIIDVLSRVYLQPDLLDPTIEFYEALFGVTCHLRFLYPAVRLELAQIGRVLLIAGDQEDLAPFRATNSTFLVDNLEAFQAHLVQHLDVQILSQPKEVPTGRNMRVRHPDGLVVEYVEHTRTANAKSTLFWQGECIHPG